MRTDGIRLAGAVLPLLLGLSAAPVRAQDAITGIGPGTEVRSINFKFEGEHTLPETDLRGRIALTARPGMIFLHKVFGWLPLVGGVGSHPFDPLALQRDVVRLRNFYHESGFLDAQVRYDVRYQAEPDLVDVTFIAREGPPLLLQAMRFVGPDSSGPAPIAPALLEPWARFTRLEQEENGRFGESERRGIADRTTRWLRNRGYPFAVALADVLVDTAANRATVTVLVKPGLRARVREIAVTGNETVPARQLTRQLPVEQGDWYDAADLERGRQQLSQLSIVRLALLNVPRGSADDSSVVVRLQVAENPSHLLRGEAGLVSTGGLTSQVEWTDRSFLGGVRSLTVAGTAQTGVLALETPSERRYRLALSVFQPYVGDRHISAAGGPFVEYRDDLRDRSQAFGFEGTLVYAESPLRSLSLGYTISHRKVLDYAFGDGLDPVDYLPLLGLADSATVGSLGTTINRSSLTLEGSWGRLDQFANPRRGYVFRPRVQVTLPGFNTSEYLLLDLGATAFVPVTGRLGFTLRAGAGRIIPYGKSLDHIGSESPFVSLLRLRDVTFTAGGTRDVRGWGSQLVGPKLPEVRRESTDGVESFTAERYTPVGGLARATASAEMQLPIPGLGPKWRSFAFLDGGKVWTPDSRFALDAGELDQERFYLGTGVGLGYETVVGAVQFAIGYKLNPSPLDLRDPAEVLAALEEGRPVSDVPTDGRRRLQLHFSIGATF
jgi:outer membrane protein insertion porin family